MKLLQKITMAHGSTPPPFRCGGGGGGSLHKMPGLIGSQTKAKKKWR